MDVTLTLSANAGLAVAIGGRRIWIDALHDHMVSGFSTLTPAMLAQLWEHESFRDPDAILCTHCHLDHFSQPLIEEAAARWPRARIFLPEPRLPRQELIFEAESEADLGCVQLRFIPLPHEHPERYSLPHWGVLLASGGHTVLFSGDCAVATPALTGALAGLTPDLAVLTFPWAALPRGRRAIREELRPSHLALCHLPFAADDRFGYRTALQRILSRYPLPCPVQVLDSFLQTVTFSL